MARRKHYFPVSAEINDDPELWTMTDRFGDRSLRVWLEVLRILDKTYNVFPDTEADWKPVFLKCRIRLATGWLLRGYWLASGWLRFHKRLASDLPSHIGSPNYWKYHTSECKQSDFTWDLSRTLLTKPNQTSIRILKNAVSASPKLDSNSNGKGGTPMSKMDLIPELRKWSDRTYFSDPAKFKRLAHWIRHCEKRGFSQKGMATALEGFWDYRAVTDWWPYLMTLLIKAEKDHAIAISNDEHSAHKAEIDELLKMANEIE